MNFEQACRAYIYSNSEKIRTIKKIQRWDTKGTIGENAKKLKVSHAYAFLFARRYKLAAVSPRERKFSPVFLRKLLRIGLTLDDIGKIMGCKRQNVHQLVKTK